MSGKPIKLAHPLPAPGCYTLDLYCDHENPDHEYDEFPHGVVQFQTRGACQKYARQRGWKLHRDGTATCPKCVQALRKPAA